MNWNITDASLQDRNTALYRAEQRGIKQGLEQGIAAFIEICDESGIPKDTIVAKLRQKFDLTEDAASAYYQDYHKN